MSDGFKQGGVVQLHQLSEEEDTFARSSSGIRVKPGAIQDDRDMHRLGKTQQLSVSWSVFFECLGI